MQRIVMVGFCLFSLVVVVAALTYQKPARIETDQRPVAVEQPSAPQVTKEPTHPVATPVTVTAPQRPSVAANQEYITKTDLGDEWPFTVDEGIIEAVTGSLAIVFKANGKTYAVNGIAQGKAFGYSKIDEIWASDPSTPRIRKSISPILTRGLKLQKQR